MVMITSMGATKVKISVMWVRFKAISIQKMYLLPTKKDGVMPKGVENITQTMFMEPKVLRLKHEGVGNARVAIGKIAENVPHVKINQSLEVNNYFI